jgi:hypothetical protein
MCINGSGISRVRDTASAAPRIVDRCYHLGSHRWLSSTGSELVAWDLVMTDPMALLRSVDVMPFHMIGADLKGRANPGTYPVSGHVRVDVSYTRRTLTLFLIDSSCSSFQDRLKGFPYSS